MIRLFIITMVTALTLTACHTVEGAGKDIEKAGDAISDSAQETRGY